MSPSFLFGMFFIPRLDECCFEPFIAVEILLVTIRSVLRNGSSVLIYSVSSYGSRRRHSAFVVSFSFILVSRQPFLRTVGGIRTHVLVGHALWVLG